MKRLGLIFVGASLFAADLTGIWIGTYPGRNNEPIDVAFQFKQSGATLTGKHYGDYESTPISEGKVTDEDVAFVVITKEQAGNQINDTRLRFTGKLVDGALELSRERESSKNVGNAGLAPVKNNAPIKMRLKKLL